MRGCPRRRAFDLNQSAPGRRTHDDVVQIGELIALLAALVAVLVAVLAYAGWRRARRIAGTRVLVGEAMRSYGITPADAEAAGLEAGILVARQRCADCAAQPSCRLLLAELNGARLPQSCPNRDFFDRVASHRKANREPPQRRPTPP